MSPTPVVAFEGISKSYPSGFLGRQRLAAVSNVTFGIETGQVFGLLGPNRAGKTTLVKLLLSLCRPTRGKVLRFGLPAEEQQTLRRVGYMHESQAFPKYLDAASLLHFYGAMAQVPDQILEHRVPRLLEQVGLADRCREPIGRFSKGMVQRLGLAQALLNDPELLVLDEPFEGLDLPGRRLFQEVVAEQRRRGRTVLIVSHVLTEVEELCDNVAVLIQGRLAYLGELEALRYDPTSGESRRLEDALQELYSGEAQRWSMCPAAMAEAALTRGSQEIA